MSLQSWTDIIIHLKLNLNRQGSYAFLLFQKVDLSPTRGRAEYKMPAISITLDLV